MCSYVGVLFPIVGAYFYVISLSVICNLVFVRYLGVLIAYCGSIFLRISLNLICKLYVLATWVSYLLIVFVACGKYKLCRF